MSRVRRARLYGAAWCLLLIGEAAAEPIELDLPGAIARAAQRAPEGVEARGRVGEAEARRVDAGVRWRDNPELEVGAGPRFGGGGSTEVDVSVRLGQGFTRGRGARQALAAAGVAQAQAEQAAVDRALAREVALGFYAALHADRVVDATRAAEELATRAADAATRRRAAGTITDLELDLARAAMGRARAAARAAEGDRAAALGRVAGLVGAAPDEVIVLRGDLRPDAASEPPGRESRGASIRRGAAARSGPSVQRADLQAIAAEREGAIAEERVASASSGWQLGAWVEYAREEDAQIVLGGLQITVPAWNRGQGARAEARARAARVDATVETRRTAAQREVRDANAALTYAREAVELYEAEVLPVLDDAAGLLERSIDAGTLPVREYLVARSELLDGRREYLDRLLALAQAHVNARFAAGEMP
jgi:cobalt-zinc-cadmium efflux system outer membrane protein